MDWLAVLTSPGSQLTIAGGLGGVARWLTLILMSKNPAVGQGVAMTGLGCILGFYVSPSFEGIVRSWFPGLSVDPEKFPTFVACVTGIGGISAVALIIDSWTRLRKQPTPPVVVEPTPPKP